MNEQTHQNPDRGPAKPVRGAPNFTKLDPPIKADPKETAQETVHQVMPKEAAKKLIAPIPAKQDAVDTPPKAARGDDDLMSKPQ